MSDTVSDPDDAPPPVKSEAFNSMAQQMDRTMAQAAPHMEVKRAGEVVRPASTDRQPVKPAANEASPAPDSVPVSPKAGDWRNLRQLRDEAVRKNKEYEKQLAEVRAESERYKTTSRIDPAELEALRAERDSYSDELERVSLERSPRFKQHYENRLSVAIDSATKAAGSDSAADVKRLLELPVSDQRKELLSEHADSIANTLDREAFTAAVREYDSATSERSAELANASSGMRALREQQAREQRTAAEQVRQQRQELARDTLRIAERSFPHVFSLNGDPQGNAVALKNRETVQKFFSGELDQSMVAMMPVMAAAGSNALIELAAAKREIADLRDATRKYQNAMPQYGNGDDSVRAPAPRSYSEQVLALVEGRE